MTKGRDGLSLTHEAGSTRRALRAAAGAVIALAAVVGMTSVSFGFSGGLSEPVVVTNSGAQLAGTISTFPAGVKKNVKPATKIAGASISFFGSAVPAEDALAGVNVNPTNGPGVVGAIYSLSDLSVLGGPDVLSGWASGATSSSTAVVGMITFATTDVPPVPIIPLATPEDLDFALIDTGAGPTAVTTGDFFVTNWLGGPTVGTPGPGSVIHFPGNAGTALNPLGLITNPFGAAPPEIPALVLQDSTTGPFACAPGVSTQLLGPVGIRLDALNNIWVVNSGLNGLGPSFITEYAPGSFGCTPPINVIGLGTLVSGAFLAIDGEGDLWVTDTLQNAVFEFAPDGTLLTEIAGKKTKIHDPMGIAIGTTGGVEDVLVANNGGGAGAGIFEFENADDGGFLNIKSSTRLQGRKTGLNQPVGLAIIP